MPRPVAFAIAQRVPSACHGEGQWLILQVGDNTILRSVSGFSGLFWAVSRLPRPVRVIFNVYEESVLAKYK